jgi:hypothetical protein
MAAAEAYFVGRSELLSWINSTLGLRINKVEEVGVANINQYTTHWEAACGKQQLPEQVLLLCLQHIHYAFPVLLWPCRQQMEP